ncbi:MAG: ABC transporter ATP-binding protein [Methylibium sp.]|jgi:branched-chain amino acid transport system ATP-binding protein|uniref:ABC transporter ATP-binding protein n=1 Tax=Methylibium sp. TaxID=2067992 RepID=UPI00275810AC|nr:ABC transporter ATP-binding protein [Methylibium sp.]
MTTDLLSLRDVNSCYGESHVLHDINLRVAEGEVVALLGRNGSGKTTTLKTVMGLLEPKSGVIEYAGRALRDASPEGRARAGIQLVPEDRRVFAGLTVEENLVLAAMGCAKPLTIDAMYEVFPRLGERKKSHGRHLSGGEQQMLSIARALIQSPRLLMLDEPFEGLAPIIVRALMEVVGRLAKEGQTIVIVEQNVKACLTLADRVYLLSNGLVVHEGSAKALMDDKETQKRHLSV